MKADFADNFFHSVYIALSMDKVLFLIVKPDMAWERIAQARRGFSFIFLTYLLPMILLATVVEGWGMAHYGKWQPRFQKLKDYSELAGTVITFEVIQGLLFLGMVLVSALVLQKVTQTFQNKRSYLQAFTTMAYGFSPLFLARLLDVAPMMSPWTPWGIGLALSIWILYQGVPRVMLPDPTQAFGVYLSAMIVMMLTSGVARVPTALYLLGWVDFKHSWLTHKFPSLFQ
jgi:hypothetical protein